MCVCVGNHKIFVYCLMVLKSLNVKCNLTYILHNITENGNLYKRTLHTIIIE